MIPDFLRPFSEPASVESYTFDSFFSDPNSIEAVLALITVVDHRTRHNPLFLCGPTGSGKTHLLRATAHEMKKRYPEQFVVLTSTNTFVATLLAAIRSDQVHDFRKALMTVDALFLDDLILRADSQTGAEIFRQLTDLAGHGVQVVATSTEPACDVAHLIGRFKRGRSVEIHYPNAQARLEIAPRCRHS